MLGNFIHKIRGFFNNPSTKVVPGEGIDRRTFVRRLTCGLFAFSILPSAKTYERIWTPTPDWNCALYCEWLYKRLPDYEVEILKDFVPSTDIWAGMLETGDWEILTNTKSIGPLISAPTLKEIRTYAIK